MDRRCLGTSRTLRFWVVIASAFALGILVERYSGLLIPSGHAPPGVEQTFRPFWEAWNLVDKFYVDRKAVQPERMTRGAIDGMLASLGDIGHTSYLTKDEYEKEAGYLAGNYRGIGARVSMRDRRPTIMSTMAGSPARAAGLKSGDVLLEVNGKSTMGLGLERVVGMVLGEPGTTVDVRVSRPGQAQPLDLTITRAEIDIPHVTWRMLPGLPIAHIAIERFGKQTDAQLKEALSAARQDHARALILDVRGDTGGLKDQAVAVASEFLKDGNILIERDADDNLKPVPVLPGGAAVDLPLCLLIDGGSASSAEIFAGAMQDHARGKLVGVRTFGAGTVLSAFDLSNGGKLLLAVYEWLTPNGRSIWRQGISPDIPVAMPEGAAALLPENEADLTAAALAKTEDKQLLKAIEVLKEQLK
jgi:carboxyl-terminal processing protease